MTKVVTTVECDRCGKTTTDLKEFFHFAFKDKPVDICPPCATEFVQKMNFKLYIDMLYYYAPQLSFTAFNDRIKEKR